MNTAHMNWSDNQLAVFDWVVNGQGNAIIEAVAGAGKTTTLVEALRRFPVNSTKAICAYNRKMGDELKGKTASLPNVTAGTLHSFGLKALTGTRGRRVQVEDKKVQRLVWNRVDEDRSDLRPCSQFIIKLVGFAKDSGIGFFTAINDRAAWQALIDHHDLSVENDVQVSYDQLVDFAIEILEASNRNREVIDFADMIYHVLIHGVPVQQYDVVMIDEAQDTNPTRRALAAKMLKAGGRLIAVGDPRQAIFGFTGADNDALDQVRTAFNATTLPLTVSYRCPKAVVDHARRWVSHIQSAPEAKQGEVKTMTYEVLTDGTTDLRAKDAILCRKNAPLVDLAFALIRKGIGCRIEGRDIGQQLIALVRKYKVRSLADLTRRISDYRDREVQKAQSKGADAKAAQIEDRVETLMVLIERAAEQKLDVDGLVKMIEGMFGDSDREPKQVLTLSTIHKAKGREWERVYLLGREQFQPSRYARQAWQLEQEINLIYVAVTRAQETLTEVTGVPR